MSFTEPEGCRRRQILLEELAEILALLSSWPAAERCLSVAGWRWRHWLIPVLLKISFLDGLKIAFLCKNWVENKPSRSSGISLLVGDTDILKRREGDEEWRSPSVSEAEP